MPTLLEVQAAMRADVLALERSGQSDLEALVVADGVAAADRLQIHRNHVFTTLGATLASIFSAVTAMVGEAFFKAAAHHYIALHPPTEPTLFAYGHDFPEFLAAFEPARGLPYLADLARLEWALHESFHAPDQPALTVAALAELPPDALPELAIPLHASARCVASDWPIDALWRACQPDAEVDVAGIDLDAGGVRLFAVRSEGDVRLWQVAEGEWRWLAALAAGGGLGKASAQASAADPAFDLATALAHHLERGSFAPLAGAD